MDAWITRIIAELNRPLPGKEAQSLMSPSERISVFSGTQPRNSAVLIALYNKNESLTTVFIKRAVYKGAHSGQVGFPGGMYEHKDLTLERTALRETQEEIGLPDNLVHIIGVLSPLHIPISNVNVFPFVGICSEEPKFTVDSREVQYIIEVGINDLLNPASRKSKTMIIAEKPIEVPYYDVNDNHIWGATAMILSEFLEVIRRTMR